MAELDRFDWERAIRRSDLHPTTRLVLFALGTYMNRDGSGARPTQETLAEACGLSARAVRNHLTAAREAGWLTLVSRGGWRGSGAGGTPMASVYAPAIPASATGTTVPVPTDRNRNDDAGSDISEPEREASEPEPHDVGTGTTVPPTTSDHGKPSSSSEQIPELVKVAARREILAKKARGEAIHNEHGLFLDVCRQLVEAQQLADQPDLHAPTADDFRESAAGLGRTWALVGESDHNIRAHVRRDLTLARFPELEQVAIDAAQDARARMQVAGGVHP